MAATMASTERKRRLKIMREFHDWVRASARTQKEIAEEIGVHPRFLRKLFSGQHPPNDDVLASVEFLLSKDTVLKLIQELEVERAKVPCAKIAVSRMLGVSNIDYCKWTRGEDLPQNAETHRRIRRVIKDLREKPDAHAAAERTRSSVKQKQPQRARGQKRPAWSIVTYDDIEKVRERLGLTKSKMAKQLGVTNSTLHNWKRGTAVPTLRRQRSIKSYIDNAFTPKLTAVPQATRDVARKATADLVVAMIQTGQINDPNDVVKLTRDLMQTFLS